MQFIKQKFMGIELDVLIGHPEHRLLFIAAQVATASGLKNPANAVGNFKRATKTKFLTIGDLFVPYQEKVGHLPKAGNGRAYHAITTLFTQAQAYQLLLRGHAPASEPFRKWVTEEVLPSIVETGAYNVNESTTETGQQFAGELAALNDAVAGLLKQNSTILGMLKELMDRPVASLAEALPSPYEGTTKSWLTDGLVFDTKTYRDVGGPLLSRPNLDRLTFTTKLKAEVALCAAWAEEDGRPLETHVCSAGYSWNKWPTTWVRSKLDRVFYRRVLNEVINERMAKI